jgi:small ligand-binding sensory domain FIST
MSEKKSIAKGAIAQHADWKQSVREILAQSLHTSVDLAILFASGAYEEHFSDIVQQVRNETEAAILIGSSGRGVLGMGKEFENEPALALLTLSLPEALLHPIYTTQKSLETYAHPEAWREYSSVSPEHVHAWLVLADPFRMDCQHLVTKITQAYTDIPIFGCLTSNTHPKRHSSVFLNEKVYNEGGICLAVGGPYTLLSAISQGCRPFGDPWTITKIQENGFVETLSHIPAYEALMSTFRTLPQDVQQRAMGNVIVGLAADDQEEALSQKNVLLRGILSADPQAGWVAFGADIWLGQKIQFHIRDAQIADADLQETLQQFDLAPENTHPVAGILGSCHSRGAALFGAPDHDANMITEKFGPLAVAGFFCNGGVTSQGMKPICRGFAASLALFMEQQ